MSGALLLLPSLSQGVQCCPSQAVPQASCEYMSTFLLMLLVGDFLAGLDLEAGGAYPLGKPSSTAGKGGATGGSQPPTLLELALSALLRAVGSGGAAGAAQLFKLDVLGLCEALWAYTTPAVVSLAQELCGAVAERWGSCGGRAGPAGCCSTPGHGLLATAGCGDCPDASIHLRPLCQWACAAED